MYNPSTAQGGDSSGEWVELFNNGTVSTDLTGLTLCGNGLLSGYIQGGNLSTEQDQGLVLPAGGFALITDGGTGATGGTGVYTNQTVNETSLALHVGASELCGALSNSGEKINLTNGTALIEELSYADIAAEGNTVERFNTHSNKLAESSQANGTPGFQNSIFDASDPIAALVVIPAIINETGAAIVNASGSTDNRAVVSFIFDFDDGNSTTTSTSILSHSFQQNGSFSVSVTAVDAAGLNSSATQPVTVNDLPPVANFTVTNATPGEDQQISFNSTSRSIADTLDTASWDFGDGSFSPGNTVNHTFTTNGTFLVVLTVNETDGSFAALSKNITVGFVNDNPTITPFVITFNEDGFLDATNLSAQVKDEEDGPHIISWTASPAANISTVILANNILNVSADKDFFGQRNLTLTAADSLNGTANVTVLVTVNAVNDVPVIQNISNKSTIQGQALSFTVVASDVDNANLTFTKDSAIGALNDSTGVFSFTPDETQYRDFSITFTATDLDGASASATANIFVFSTLDITQVRLFNATGSKSIVEGQVIQDVQQETPLNLTLTLKNIGSVRIDDIIAFLDAPNLDLNEKNVTFGSINTSKNISRNLSVTIPLEDTPVGIHEIILSASGKDDSLGNTPRFSNFSFFINVTKELHKVIISKIDFSKNPVKCEPQAFVIPDIMNIGQKNETIHIAITQPQLSLSDIRTEFLEVDSLTDPSAAVSLGNKSAGTYPVAVTVLFDRNFSSVTDTSSLVIENCEPNVTLVPSIFLDEGTTGNTIDLGLFFSDFNNDTLAFSSEGAQNISVSIVNATAIINSPTNFNGTNKVNFSAFDGRNITKSNEVTITVNPVNDVPQITAIPDQTVSQGTQFTLQVQATDVENDPLFFNLTANSTISLNINQSGFISGFTPSNDDRNKVFLVNVIVDDGQNKTAEAFVLSVTNLNDAPQFDINAPLPNIALNEDTSATLNLASSFSDADGDSLSFTATSVGDVVILINQSSGIATIIPSGNVTGLRNVSFRASDGSLQSGSSNDVLINITPVNDAPSFIGFIGEDIAVVGTPFTLQFNATDIDGDTVTFTDNSTLFDIDPVTGLIEFSPDVDGVGTEISAITASDGQLSNSELFSITIVDVLSIDQVQASVNSGTFADLDEGATLGTILSPGSTLKIKVSLTNHLENEAVAPVRLDATIANDSFTVATKIVDIQSIAPGATQTVTLDLGAIPSVGKDLYDFAITALGEFDQSEVQASFSAFANIKSQANQILLEDAQFSPSSVACTRSASLIASIKNVDFFNEPVNASITAANSQLGITASTSAQEIPFNGATQITLPVSIPLSAAAGVYTFSVSANTTDNTSAQGSAQITVQDCKVSFAPVDDPIIKETGTQVLSISDLSDFKPVSIQWDLDGQNVSSAFNQTSFTFGPDGRQGRKFHQILVKAKDAQNTVIQKLWRLTSTSFPIVDTLATIPNLASLNSSQLEKVNLTLSKANTGTLEFLSEVNLSSLVVLDGHVNFSRGIIAVDTSGDFDSLDTPARITLTGLTYTQTPNILFSDLFTANPADFIQRGRDCTNTFCFIENATAAPTTSGTITFTVTHLSSYMVNSSQVSQPGNQAPRANAGSDQTVDENSLVTLDGSQSTDTDGTIVSFSWNQTGGTPVALTSPTSATATFTAPTLGSLAFTLTVVDNSGASASDSVAITVGEVSNLKITDLDIEVGDKTSKDVDNGDTISREAKPGDTVAFDLEISNTFSSSTDTQIEDIEAEITIKNIDDGDDLEETVDVSDLDAGDDDSVTLSFKVPTIVEEDSYDVEIVVDGEDEDGKTHRTVFNLKLDVEKDDNEILLDRASLSSSEISCERKPSLSFRIVNIGSDDQDDVAVEVESSELNLLRKFENIRLEEGDDEDDVAYANTASFTVADSLNPGTYPIRIKVFDDDGDLADESTLSLEVKACKARQTTPVQGRPGEIDVVTLPGKSRPTVPVTTISFRDTSAYLIILTTAFVVLLGGVVIVLLLLIATMKGKSN